MLGSNLKKLDNTNTAFPIGLYEHIIHGTNSNLTDDASAFHLQDYVQLSICVSGEMTYSFEKCNQHVRTGDIIMINAFTPHKLLDYTSDLHCYSLEYYPSFFSANSYSKCYIPFFNLMYSQNYPFIFLDKYSPFYRNAKHYIQESVRLLENKSFAFDTAVHNQLFDFSVDLLPLLFTKEQLEIGRTSHGELIHSILAYIDENLSQPLLISHMAEEFGMNTSYFSVYFKKHTGVSYKKFINTKRISAAANLLKNTDEPITNIIYICGFSSPSAFYKAFASVYKASPSDFRKIQVGAFDG